MAGVGNGESVGDGVGMGEGEGEGVGATDGATVAAVICGEAAVVGSAVTAQACNNTSAKARAIVRSQRCGSMFFTVMNLFYHIVAIMI